MNSLPQQAIREVTCAGTSRDMGVVQGHDLRDSIHEALETLARLEAVRLMKPAWLPFAWFWRMAEFRGQRFLRRAFSESSTDAAARLPGIAEGAGLPFRTLALCSVMEAVLSDLSHVTNVPLSAGCSAVAVTGSATADELPILAHNFDYLPVTQPYYVIRRSNPRRGLRSVEFTIAPLAGTVSGINEAGLSISCNYAYATDRRIPAPTITMRIADALARFRTVDEAAVFLEQSPRVGGGLLMLADATGRIAALEVSSSRISRRNPDPGSGVLFHTNRYNCPALRSVEIDERAVHGANAPEAMRGRRVHESADERATALRKRFDHHGVLDRTALHQIMSDHGPENSPSGRSVCMHGNYWHTTATLQLIPAERLLRASFSPACVAEFQDFHV